MQRQSLMQKTLPYANPAPGKSNLQLADSLLPYFAMFAGMVYLVEIHAPYWIVLLLAPLAAAFLVRTFILFHDCTHLSFFSSRTANRIVGTILGILVFTPYDSWGDAHIEHHATVANLDKRNVGDVWTLTVEEYRNASPALRLGYRLVRSPWVMFGLGPIWVFLIKQRFPLGKHTPREILGFVINDLGILAILAAFHFTLGLGTWARVQLPIIYLAGMGGIWLFYVQHQYPNTVWYRDQEWNFINASLLGASYYKLPRVLQWFSGNIGLHHVHHINPRIPNYRLQACLDNTPELQTVAPLTIRESLKTPQLNLWDEANNRLVSFRSLRTA